MPTPYDFYMCDAPADDPDDELYELFDEEVSEDFPELEGEEREDKIRELIAAWKYEQLNRY